MKRSMGWFTTGRDIEAVNLLKTVFQGIEDGRIEGRISFIFMNREPGEGEFSDRIMDLAGKWGIPLINLSSARFKPELWKNRHNSPEIIAAWRHQYHHEVLERLQGMESEFSVLAGYMLIVSPEMCRRLSLINLHPAPPKGPAGTWQEVIWQLIASKASESGVMIHMVTPELDQGPPITYCLYRITGTHFSRLWEEMDGKLRKTPLHEIKLREGENNALFRMIRAEGVKREIPLLFETIRWLSSGRIVLKENKVYFENSEQPKGVCLNDQVESLIAASA
ncbi:MAG: formyltransferase family protein [bacterium]